MYRLRIVVGSLLHIMSNDRTHTQSFQYVGDETEQLLSSTTMAIQISIVDECHYCWSFFLNKHTHTHTHILSLIRFACVQFFSRTRKKMNEKEGERKKRRPRGEEMKKKKKKNQTQQRFLLRSPTYNVILI